MAEISQPPRDIGDTLDSQMATKRLLVIDDQPRVLEVLRDLLASFQHGYVYEITTTQSVAEALAILQREAFDLILLDMVMPGIGNPAHRRQGLAVMKRIRDLGVTTPVLMMSGDYEVQKEADALIDGAVGYLHKPFNMAELDRLVARAIESAPP